VAPTIVNAGILSGLTLFKGLSTRELERLASLMHERSFPAGANVLTAEQSGEAIYVILKGSVKVHLLTADGTEVILAVLGPGEMVGEMSATDSMGRSADVTTLEESAFLWMDRRAFRSSVESSTVLACNLAEILSKRVRLTNAHLLSLATLDVSGRVASQLLALASEYGKEKPKSGGVRIPIKLTQSDLAKLVGASRVRVNQALGYFRKRDVISVGIDGCIVVHDPESLARRTR
jgi:CRP/FNR family transcriptional regulator, cyclic AMP receptor protein